MQLQLAKFVFPQFKYTFLCGRMIKHINVFGKGRIYKFCKNSLETHLLISLLTLHSTDVMVLFLETLCGTLYFLTYAQYPLADNGK